MSSFFQGKTVLVTGATGSIGSEVVRQLLLHDPFAVRVFSRDEYKQYLLQHELAAHEEKIRYFLGDVRDYPRLQRALEGVDYVFHCAAYKHVPFCEYNSFEAVKTNVVGTQNLIEAALQQHVSRILLVSTDKAASPTNVMGATKLLAERLMTSAMQSRGAHPSLFSSVRFGNVLGSRGSVIPMIQEQIRRGGPVTVTHPDMVRFFMSIPQAVSLTFDAMQQMEGGELFILKMPVARLGDLVDVLIEQLAPRYGRNPNEIDRKIIGVRPGEKMQEVLMTSEEAQTARETDSMFIVRSPLLKLDRESRTEGSSAAVRRYTSEDMPLLTRDEIAVLLKDLLPEDRELDRHLREAEERATVAA